MFKRSSKSKEHLASSNGKSDTNITYQDPQEEDFQSAFEAKMRSQQQYGSASLDGVVESSGSGGLDETVTTESEFDNGQLPFEIVTMEGQKLNLSFVPEEQGSLLMRVHTDDLDCAPPEDELKDPNLQALASEKLQELDAIRDMGIIVQASVAKPFIGLLVVRVKGIREWKGRKNKVHIQTIFESDKSKAIPCSPNSKKDHIFFDEDTVFAFIRLFTQSNITFVVKDKHHGPRLATSILAGVELSLVGLKQGRHDISIQVCRQDRKRTPMGILDIEIDYKFLRGTKDNGDYNGPERTYIEPRRMRAKLNINSGVEYLSNVNHWLMSHDNIFCVSSPASIEESQNSSQSVPTSGSQQLHIKDTPCSRLFWDTNSLKEQQAFNQEAQSATDKVFSSNLKDALHPQSTDSECVKDLKEKMLACMVMFSERISTLEYRQDQMMDVIKQLCNESQVLIEQQDVQPHISGRFEYGFGRPGRNRIASIFAIEAIEQDAHCPSGRFLGNYRTDNRGLLTEVPLPDQILQKASHYNIMAFLPEDNTFAKGSLFMLQPNTPCVVFDLDGTITVGDKEVVTQFALNALGGSLAIGDSLPKNYDLKPRHHALTVVRMWAAKGYQPIYLSGRQGSFYNLTLEWLMKHGYPPGPIHLTRTHMPTLPVYYSVGNFKVQYIETLKSRGLEIFAAYGNTGTDIRAYEAVGIPKERTFIVGPNGGKGGTQKVDDFSDHILEIMNYPDADPAIPYTELLYAKMPEYRRGRRPSQPYGTSASEGLSTIQSDRTSDELYQQQYYHGKNRFKDIDSFADSEFQE
eukprot:TRINITY_DN147_c1_g1_i3.p1 TRINITY_DN147_c1_g1~~TRINITY_DN147_c1_g1_i3.p1  ORF type:complete len:802 (+),score=62.20 TRINITY_DN147_c1_g1_i3:219-2624(+)